MDLIRRPGPTLGLVSEPFPLPVRAERFNVCGASQRRSHAVLPQPLWRGSDEQRRQIDRLRRIRPVIIARPGHRLVEGVGHVRERPEGAVGRADGQRRGPLSVDLLCRSVSPVTGFDVLPLGRRLVRPTVLRVEDVHVENRPRCVRLHRQHRHAFGGVQHKRRPRRRGGLKRPLEMLVEPQLRGDFVLRGVLMVVMRGANDPPLIGGDFLNRLRKIADPPVEIVRGAEKNNGTGDLPQTDVVAQRRVEQRAVVVAIADAAAGGRRGLHAVVDGGHHREFPAHGMPVDAQPVGVDRGLILQKRQCPPGGHGGEEPPAVPRRLDGIQRPRRRLGAGEDVPRVAAGGVIAVDGAPVGGRSISGVVRLAIPEQFHLGGADSIIFCRDAPRPRDRDRGVPAFRVGDAGVRVGELPAAVDLHQPGDRFPLRQSRRSAVDRGERRLLPFKDADTESHDL
ncbi:hypothetical protein LzC2_38240 [Planctomycetes bacterium LzC2]|uniref:Uncharacterized protein n=1 Tax=Alienimonas chondri TaxID=2681879 RepID=A0ABX1VHZ8_9PLAN|nr:hypothetical protein [Alienimonas chondri]